MNKRFDKWVYESNAAACKEAAFIFLIGSLPFSSLAIISEDLEPYIMMLGSAIFLVFAGINCRARMIIWLKKLEAT